MRDTRLEKTVKNVKVSLNSSYATQEIYPCFYILYKCLITIIDLNECELGLHHCSQDCTNINGSFICSCREGFVLSDLFSGVCKAVDPKLTIVYTNGPELRGYESNERKHLSILGNEKRIRAIDYDPKTEILYWADSYDHSIKRSYMVDAKSGQVKVGYPQDLDMMKGPFKPVAVAIDWMGDNLYWAEVDLSKEDKPAGGIMVSKQDGRYKRSIISSGTYI